MHRKVPPTPTARYIFFQFERCELACKASCDEMIKYFTFRTNMNTWNIRNAESICFRRKMQRAHIQLMCVLKGLSTTALTSSEKNRQGSTLNYYVPTHSETQMNTFEFSSRTLQVLGAGCTMKDIRRSHALRHWNAAINVALLWTLKLHLPCQSLPLSYQRPWITPPALPPPTRRGGTLCYPIVRGFAELQ